MEPTTVTRKQLYGRVWETPGWILAKEYCVSDVALVKICRRHNIPRPPRGYWAKRAVGKKVRQRPLPDPEQDPHIRIGRLATLSQGEREHREKSPPIKPIAVRDRLVGLHPLVKQTKEWLEKCDEADRWNHPQGAHLAVDVSKGSRRRALLVMDALILALEERGHKVALVPNGYGCWYTCAVIDNIKVKFEVGETTGTSRDAKPTRMKMTLDIHREGVRRTWGDGLVQVVEKLLPDFLWAMEAEAAYLREKIDEEKIEMNRIEAERARRAEAVREHIQEEGRLSRLRSNAKAWKEAQDIRQYIAAVKAAAEENGANPQEDETGEWLEWALAQADRLDPLAPSPNSILDTPPPSSWHAKDRGLHSYVRWNRHLLEPEDGSQAGSAD